MRLTDSNPFTHCLVLLTATSALAIASRTELPPLELKQASVFFVGAHHSVSGTESGSVSNSAASSAQVTGQSMIHYFAPKEKRDVSVVLYPGLGLTSYIFLATPDGREGWATLFARHGFTTYVYDVPNTGISGFDIAPFNRVRLGDIDVTQQPNLAIWNNQQIWRRWGFGPEAGTPYENTRFPVEDIDQFLAAMNPRVGGGGGRGRRRAAAPNAPDPVLENFIELLERTGPAVIVLHSWAGRTGLQASVQRPDLVRGVVVVEPVGCPSNPADPFFQTEIPFLAVYGDFIEERGQAGRLEACRSTAEILAKRGVPADMLVLPEIGIAGNTHLMMQDDNNEDIAGRIVTWITDHVDGTSGD